MADPNTRQGKRTPVTLKIKFKSETLEQFIERYAVDVSQGGIFIRTKEPLAVGTQMKFEFQLRDASPLIAGEGTVVWTRENDPSRPAIAPGMGVRFDRLADGSQTVLERILAEKAKQAPQRSGNEGPTKPPLFTDTPTRVAPAPVQDALGVGSNRRPKSDSEQTPLPPPRPFHSDADDFDEKAFEEATKVRSLDELAAQTAGLVGAEASDDAPTNTAISMPPDELAARRQAGRPDSLGEPAAPPAAASGANVDRESVPNLPEPPKATRSKPPLEAPSEDQPAPRTRLGVQPAKAQTRAASAAPEAVGPEPSIPHAPSRPSAAPIIILLLVLVAGAAGAVWWFVLRPEATENVAQKDPGSNGSAAVATNPANGSDGSNGSAGSAEQLAQNGSDGSAGSAAVEAPKGPIVDTVIASSVSKGAIVAIADTDQKGPAPFTAKLEKDKVYKAIVSAPGFTTQELDVKGGQDKLTAKLVAKKHVLSVTTDPPGADIYIDSVNTQKITPSDIELTAAQAAKPRVRVSLRRPGYRPIDQVVDAAMFKDNDAQMTASLNAKLTVMQRPTGGGSGGNTGGNSSTTNTGSGTTSGSGSGSAATPPTGGGTGSAATPPTGGGTGSTTPPSGGGGNGTGSAAPTTPGIPPATPGIPQSTPGVPE
ncbi:MAG TPA: TIGR02266 family protein [Kofleriaceae bacterium]|nr:TIGR02266 family protein [Kofleriaceae bacterium]